MQVQSINDAKRAAAAPRTLNAADLAVLVKAGIEQAGKADAFMVRDFLKGASNTATTDVFGALKEFAKKKGGTWEGVGLKYESARVYASGFRQIIGAVRYAEFTPPDGIGFQPCVATCREVLEKRGIKANGERILSEEEEQRREQSGLIVDAAEMRRDILNKTGEDIGEAEAMRRVQEADEVNQARRLIYRTFEQVGKNASATYLETFLAELQTAVEAATHRADWSGYLKDWAGIKDAKAVREQAAQAAIAEAQEKAAKKAAAAAKRKAAREAKAAASMAEQLATIQQQQQEAA